MAENDTMPVTGKPGEPKGPSLRDVLRAASDRRHERLDRLFDGLDGSDTLAYRRFLVMNEACHRVLEPLIAASPLARVLPDVADRPRASLLARDVAALGVARLEPGAFPLTAPDLDEAGGLCYVLEGSRLGARFIHRRLKDRVAEPASLWSGLPLGYLESAEEPDRFRSLMTQLERLLATQRQRMQAAVAANATFDYFIETERLAALSLNGCSSALAESRRTA